MRIRAISQNLEFCLSSTWRWPAGDLFIYLIYNEYISWHFLVQTCSIHRYNLKGSVATAVIETRLWRRSPTVHVRVNDGDRRIYSFFDRWRKKIKSNSLRLTKLDHLKWLCCHWPPNAGHRVVCFKINLEITHTYTRTRQCTVFHQSGDIREEVEHGSHWYISRINWL